MTVEKGQKISNYILEVVSPVLLRGQVYSLPQTGRGKHQRALEVGYAPYKYRGVRIDHDKLQRVHFYLQIEGEEVWLYRESECHVALDGEAVRADEWHKLADGTLLDCGAGIQLRLGQDAAVEYINQGEAFGTPLFKHPLPAPHDYEGDNKTALVPSVEETAARPATATHYRLRIDHSRYSLTGQVEFTAQNNVVVEIGRDPTTPRRLFVDDPKASKRHAYLKYQDGQVWLYDGTTDSKAGSRNGTFVFQAEGGLRRLDPAVPELFGPGSIFRIGYTDIILEEI